MTILCRLFGHDWNDWQRHESESHYDRIRFCKRCCAAQLGYFVKIEPHIENHGLVELHFHGREFVFACDEICEEALARQSRKGEKA